MNTYHSNEYINVTLVTITFWQETVTLLILASHVYLILCEKQHEQICSSAFTSWKNPLLVGDYDQRTRVNSLIERLLCRLLFIQYKNTWLVRIRLCSFVGIRRYR